MPQNTQPPHIHIANQQIAQAMAINYWSYEPNKVAPIIFAVLFLATGALHAYQTWRYKSTVLTLLIPWGATVMAAGYCIREAGAYSPDSLNFLIASTVLVLAGPPVYAGANYFVLGRTLYYIPYLSPLRPGRILTTFVGMDLVVETLTATGAAKRANLFNDASDRKLGSNLVKAGLVIQATTFVAYFVLLALFHYRVRKANLLSKNLNTVIWTMYASSALILTRCIYRIAQYFQGYSGTLYTHEVYFYVFEASLMSLNSVLLHVLHPGKYFAQGQPKVYLALDGETECIGPGFRDQRRWLLQILDPFDVFGVFQKRESDDFWNHSQVPAGPVLKERESSLSV